MRIVYLLEVGPPSVPGFDLRSTCTATDRDARNRYRKIFSILRVVVPLITILMG